MDKYQNVAIVIHPLLEWGGAEQTLRVFISMFDRVTVYTSYTQHSYLEENFPGLNVKSSIPFRGDFIKSIRGELTPLQPLLYKMIKPSGYDLVIVISDGFEKLIRLPGGTRIINYILTPPRFLWMSGGGSKREGGRPTFMIYDKLLKSPLSALWKRWDRSGARRYTENISISNEVRNRVEGIYGLKSEVIYPPVEVSEVTPNHGVREDFFLFLNRIEEYKGIKVAIDAAIKGKVKLKVAGKGSKLDEMIRYVEQNQAQQYVEFLGFVSEDDKYRLLGTCQALLYPVYKEDFGIVPVEASAAGTPVIAFASGGALETVVDGETGYLFKQYTADSLLGAISRFKEEAGSISSAECRKHAGSFSIEVFKDRFSGYLDGSEKR